jgi:hypothetical protein
MYSDSSWGKEKLAWQMHSVALVPGMEMSPSLPPVLFQL